MWLKVRSIAPVRRVNRLVTRLNENNRVGKHDSKEAHYVGGNQVEEAKGGHANFALQRGHYHQLTGNHLLLLLQIGTAPFVHLHLVTIGVEHCRLSAATGAEATGDGHFATKECTGGLARLMGVAADENENEEECEEGGEAGEGDVEGGRVVGDQKTGAGDGDQHGGGDQQNDGRREEGSQTGH